MKNKSRVVSAMLSEADQKRIELTDKDRMLARTDQVGASVDDKQETSVKEDARSKAAPKPEIKKNSTATGKKKP